MSDNYSTDQLKGLTFSPTTYEGFKAFRAKSNAPFTAFDDGNSITLTAAVWKGQRIATIIDKFAIQDQANLADYEATLAPFANDPIDVEEIRPQTHNFAVISDWNCKSHGLFLRDENGAACGPAGGVRYDEDAGKWYDSLQGGNVVAQLDTSVNPHVWKDGSGNILCSFSSGHWRDSNGNITDNSLVRFKPKDGYKIEIRRAKTECDLGATVQTGGDILYRVYSYVDAYGLVLPVKDWTYESVAKLRSAGDHHVDPVAMSGHATPLLTINYDYSDTHPQVLDYRAKTKQVPGAAYYLDVSTKNNLPVLDTVYAWATFIARRMPSF